MACRLAHPGSSGVRSDQQGTEQTRAGLPWHPCRGALSQATAVARRSGQTSGTSRITGHPGASVKSGILVVEDNPLNSELLCDWLEARGYEVHSVENIAAAQVSIENKEPDVVFLDVQLGDEDGLALAVWMRKQPTLCRVPVIAVTAHAMVTEQQRFLQAGSNACVPKPVDFQLLSEQLEYWLAPRLSIPTQ